jgi:hypothetical protein
VILWIFGGILFKRKVRLVARKVPSGLRKKAVGMVSPKEKEMLVIIRFVLATRNGLQHTLQVH